MNIHHHTPRRLAALLLVVAIVGGYLVTVSDTDTKNPVAGATVTLNGDESPSFHLSNNNANIRRVQQRINDLKNRGDFVGWEFPGGRAEINEGENRLQLFFDEKPTEEQRRELKQNGFKWAPSQGAWQRQLNRNAIFAAGRIDFLRTEDGQSPVRLQPFARREREEPSR